MQKANAKMTALAFCIGWKEYRGCKIEHECAVQYGIEIVCD